MAQTDLTEPVRVVLIGGSTGSIEVLLHVLPALRAPLSFALLFVLHRNSASDSTLAHLLAMKTDLPLQEVEDKDAAAPGAIYLAPADYHLLLEQDGTFSLDDSEKVHFSRPAIDVTFESAAEVYGPAVVGILLSGANADGTAGLRAIRQAGGRTLAQHPDSAQVPFMPQHAIEAGVVDRVLTVDELVAWVSGLSR